MSVDDIFLLSGTYVLAYGGLSEHFYVNDPLSEGTRPYLKVLTCSRILPLCLNTISFFGEFDNATTLVLFLLTLSFHLEQYVSDLSTAVCRPSFLQKISQYHLQTLGTN